MKLSFSKFLVLMPLFIGISVFGQVHNPVKWHTQVKKISNNNYLLVSKATLEKGWHIYSQFVKPGGPISTYFNYPKESGMQLIGKTTEPKGITKYEEVFGMNVTYFEGQVVFTQKMKLSKKASLLKATVEYMACDEKNCLPPKQVDLVFKIQQDTSLKKVTHSQQNQGGGTWLFVLSFLAGLSALFTPCVFPMIPMTVSFFTKQSNHKWIGVKNALIYGGSIVVIYVLLGTLVVGFFGANALNKLATSVVFNLVFFGLLVLFALSFLGAFELVLPSSWATKLDDNADRGGVIGIFFMALALAVVSFSCTGPIVGTALVQSATHGGIGPIISMLGFSLAIALPFTLFAVFPSWLSSLPKSGGWLNTVKVVLGFIELALAFKFLSNADLVLQSHWLEREVFLAIWIGIGFVLFLYLIGKIRLPHDTQVLESLSVTRLVTATTVLVLLVYLIPGLFGAPVKLVNAYLPPVEYSESPYGVGNRLLKTSGDSAAEKGLPQGAHYFAPYKIVTFNDYDKGLAYATKVNKPILLDFTGRACVNCRKMEQNVWSNPQVLQLLENELVLISLYVDDRQKNTHKEMSPYTGKPYDYVGQKWAEFQEKRYQTNAQPFYVMLNSHGVDISKPIGYTPVVNEYLSWLQTAVNKNKE